MTLFPGSMRAVLGESIIGRAAKKGAVEINCVQIRDYTENKQMQVDDYPYGGGWGLVMMAQPLKSCLDDIMSKAGSRRSRVIYISPQGRPFNQEEAKRLRRDYDHLVLVCGHYEGVDERFIEECVDEELSLGDFVLTGGEIAAMAVADCVCRMVPGVLADEECYTGESHWDGLLEYPQYTRPEVWEGRAVPPVLLTGDHKKIAAWRARQSHARTMARRPDLYEAWCRTHPLTPGRWKRSERAELIRTEAAWDAAAAIYAAGWQQLCAGVCTPEYIAAHTPQVMKQQLLADRAAGWAFYLHSTAGVPDALVGVCHKTGEIGRLYVDPAAQGQGIGAKLLAFARKKLAEHPQPHLYALDTNRRAIALYLRMGYRPAGVGCVYDPAVDPNATVFCREIKFIYGTKNSG